MKEKSFTFKKNFLVELLALILNVFLAGVVWGFGLSYIYYCFNVSSFFLLTLTPLLVSLFYVLVVWTIRLALPKVVPGTYDLKKDKMVVIWYLHMCLNRSVKSVGILFLIRSSSILKYLHLKALGAKVSYSVNYSAEIEIADPSLITIESDVIIGGRCYIGCHMVFRGMLTLGEVIIKKNSFVSFRNTIGPGTVVGEGAIVGSGNYLYNNKIPDGYRLPNFEWHHGSPNVRKKFLELSKENLSNPKYDEFHREYEMRGPGNDIQN